MLRLVLVYSWCFFCIPSHSVKPGSCVFRVFLLSGSCVFRVFLLYSESQC